jgi:hypothetical protein
MSINKRAVRRNYPCRERAAVATFRRTRIATGRKRPATKDKGSAGPWPCPGVSAKKRVRRRGAYNSPSARNPACIRAGIGSLAVG